MDKWTVTICGKSFVFTKSRIKVICGINEMVQKLVVHPPAAGKSSTRVMIISK
jgi:hypothetical protein